MPGPTRRERGTIQHADWTIKRNRSLDYEEPFYLVVRSRRGWQEGNEEQSYAVVISLEHSSSEVRLYDELRVRTQAIQRARVRG